MKKTQATKVQAHTLVGFHAVSSALKAAPGDVEWLRVDETSQNKRLREIESRAGSAGIEIVRTSVADLDRIS